MLLEYFVQFVGHLLLQFGCLFGGALCKVGAVGGVDDAARRVDEESAVAVEAVAAHFAEAAALGADTGDEEETVWDYVSYRCQHIGLGGSDDVHHIVRCAPLLRFLQHFLEEVAVVVFGLDELEVEGAFVGGKCQQDNPFAVVDGKWRHGVFAHIGGYGHRVEIEVALGVEEGFGILLRGVANVAALGVGNGKCFVFKAVEVIHSLLELDKAFDAGGFVEGQVGFVGHGVGQGGVDDGLVEKEDAVFFVLKVLGHFADVGVESDAEEGLFATYGID